MHRNFITGIMLMLIFASLCTAGCLQSTTPPPPSVIPTTLTGATGETPLVSQGTTRVPSSPGIPASTAVNTTMNNTPAPSLTSTVPPTTSMNASAPTTQASDVPTLVAGTSATPGTPLTAVVTPAPRVNATQTGIPGVQSILAILSGDPRFTTLRNAVGAAEITGILNGSDPVTIFAPTNGAFSSLPPGSVDALLADPGGELKEILLYHIVPGKLTVQDLSGVKTLTTLQGEKLEVEVVNGTIVVDEIEVIIPDIHASNGEIQGIGGILIPSNL